MVDGVIARRADGTVLDTDPDRLDVEVVHRWLAENAYWARGRSRETVERSIRGSRVAAAYDGDTMLAFARAVTDGATFGWLCDVYRRVGFEPLRAPSEWMERRLQ